MNSYRKHGIALLAGALLLAGTAGNALALTGACSTVTNQATLAFSVGGVPQPNILSDGDPAAGTQTTDFTVATKVDLTVSTFNSPVTATGVDQVLIFRVTNTGNDTQDYMLQLYTGAGETVGAFTDNFNMSNVRVYVDTTPDGSYDGDETLLATNPANGADMGQTGPVAGNVGVAPANVVEIIVRADVPGGRATGDDALYTLKARTYQTGGNLGTDGNADTETGNTATDGNTQNSCTSDVVLADGDADLPGPATGVGGAADGANDGDSYATGVYTVSAANIAVTKSVTVLWDPVNGGAPNAVAIPGAYVQYAVAVTNSGTASATLTTITDSLVATLAIDPDLIDGTAAAPTPGAPESGAGDGFRVVVTNSTRAANAVNQYFSTANDGDGVEHNAGTITATFATILPVEGVTYAAGELKSGETVTLTFNAIIQ